MYAPLAGCLVQAEAGCESFGVGGGEEVGGVWTACAYMCGVCVASVRRLCGVWAASVRRPDWGCGAEWTPCESWCGWRLCGVQIWDVRRNGRHVLEWAASRFEMWGGMDARRKLKWRPDLGCEADWTPCAGVSGVQIRDVERNGRHVLEWAAS